jgi:hypothetical protein
MLQVFVLTGRIRTSPRLKPSQQGGLIDRVYCTLRTILVLFVAIAAVTVVSATSAGVACEVLSSSSH